MAAVQMVGEAIEVVPCALSAEVFDALAEERAEAAVLPIENSLHGSVAEHYDLLLERDISIEGEGLLRIVHNVIAMPGVRLDEVKHLLSHPVALSQCRKYLAEHREMQAGTFYDTAGSVKHVMAQGLRDTAGIAPALAAEVYGGEVLVAGVEDNPENFTRFHLLRRRAVFVPADVAADAAANKMSVAFVVAHRPGTLVAALAGMADAGADLTRIESRPVPGKPWEYVFSTLR